MLPVSKNFQETVMGDKIWKRTMFDDIKVYYKKIKEQKFKILKEGVIWNKSCFSNKESHLSPSKKWRTKGKVIKAWFCGKKITASKHMTTGSSPYFKTTKLIQFGIHALQATFVKESRF